MATEAAWLDGDNLGKEEIKKKKEKMKKRFDTHRPLMEGALFTDEVLYTLRRKQPCLRPLNPCYVALYFCQFAFAS